MLTLLIKAECNSVARWDSWFTRYRIHLYSLMDAITYYSWRCCEKFRTCTFLVANNITNYVCIIPNFITNWHHISNFITYRNNNLLWLLPTFCLLKIMTSQKYLRGTPTEMVKLEYYPLGRRRCVYIVKKSLRKLERHPVS